jgi:hypothetical protein
MSRQLIFILIALSVAVPLVIKIGLPNEVSSEVMQVYEEIDQLDSGSVIMVSFDHEASSLPEVKPMAKAILRHCFAKKLKVVGLALLAEGTVIGDQILRETADEYNAEYGRDYVFLGFRPQYQAAILGMGEDIKRVFPEDYRRYFADNLGDRRRYAHLVGGLCRFPLSQKACLRHDSGHGNLILSVPLLRSDGGTFGRAQRGGRV